MNAMLAELKEVRQRLAGAVDALQAIYNRHHMNGDGSAGKVSGEALRALGIDPDAESESRSQTVRTDP